MSVDFGLALPEGAERLEDWLDSLGPAMPTLNRYVRSLWMTDHLFWEDRPAYESWTVMAYLAARYPQFHVGSMVIGQNYRNPALLAKMAASLQCISRGRLLLGVGAGWKEDEYRAYNYAYPRPGVRLEQLEDTLEIVRRMWSEAGKVTYEGKHYRVVDAYCEPKPDPAPPLIVGGGGNKTLRLAARFADWWNLPDATIDHYTERVNVLKSHCADVGRDPDSIHLTWFGRIVLGRTHEDALKLGGGRWRGDNAFVGTPQQIIEQMQPFIDMGVDYFMVEVLGLPDADIVAMLADVLGGV